MLPTFRGGGRGSGDAERLQQRGGVAAARAGGGEGRHRPPPPTGVELAVARHLAASGAPVVAPASQVPRVVHRAGGPHVTGWDYHPGHGDSSRAGANRPPPWPRFITGWVATRAGCRPGVRNWPPWRKCRVSRPGRRHCHPATGGLLSCALERFEAELAPVPGCGAAAAGSPHSGNIMVTRTGIRFLDFETACTGPLEWDLVHAGEDRPRLPGPPRPALLGVCRGLVSVNTPAWCWAEYGHPALRWHAEHHLAAGKTLMAPQ